MSESDETSATMSLTISGETVEMRGKLTLAPMAALQEASAAVLRMSYEEFAAAQDEIAFSQVREAALRAFREITAKAAELDI